MENQQKILLPAICDLKQSNDEDQPRHALIFGTSQQARGLYGLELAKAGYRLTFADTKNPVRDLLEQEKRYFVDVNDSRFDVSIDGVLDLADEHELARTTTEAGLVIVSSHKRALPQVGRSLGRALYGGYCQIDRHDRHFLNIVACTHTYRPANTLRYFVHRQWAELPNGHYLTALGVSKMRITNGIGRRHCTESAQGIIQAHQNWDWTIEEKIWARWIGCGMHMDMRPIDTPQELEKWKKQDKAGAASQFLGRIHNLPEINYIDNIAYESLFKNGKHKHT